MANFLFVYRNSLEAELQQPSPEEMQAVITQWEAWFSTIGENVVNGGDALLPTGKIVKSDGAVTDGPFIEAKELVGGFSIIKADSYDAAVVYAKTCPMMLIGGSVEIRELAETGG